MLIQCKSFANALIIQTCGNNKQLDYATPRSTNCACSAVFKQNRFNLAKFLVRIGKQMNTLHIYGSKNILK